MHGLKQIYCPTDIDAIIFQWNLRTLPDGLQLLAIRSESAVTLRAAKWMTESMGYFAKTPLTASRLVISTFSNGTDFPTIASIRRSASVDELYRLSIITTLYPD